MKIFYRIFFSPHLIHSEYAKDFFTFQLVFLEVLRLLTFPNWISDFLLERRVPL